MPESDLDQLHEAYPDWRFGSVWCSAASKPDARRLTASKDGVLLTAWDAAGLREQIAYEETRGSQHGK
jgi:hypothetical protein